MSIPTTARYGFPMLAAGQAQKELTHNEALLLADFLINPVAEELGRNAPPATPAAGQSWILGGTPSGAWAGRAGQVACWTAGGWRYLSPFEGLHIWVRDTQLWAVRGAADWLEGVVRAEEIRVNDTRVIGARQPAIADPSGGTTIDMQARDAIAAILATLRTHGLISA